MIESEITMVQGAIHNTSDLRHYMTLTNIPSAVSAKANDVQIAWSNNVLKLKAVARDINNPTYYFPSQDVRMDLLFESKKTPHCRLKGDTRYYTLRVGSLQKDNAAWRYHQPLDTIRFLENYIAFDCQAIQIIEYTPEK